MTIIKCILPNTRHRPWNTYTRKSRATTEGVIPNPRHRVRGAVVGHCGWDVHIAGVAVVRPCGVGNRHRVGRGARDVVIDAAALKIVGEGRRQRRRQQKEHANAQSIKLSHNRFFYVCNFYLSCRSRRDAKVCVSANRLRLPSQT